MITNGILILYNSSINNKVILRDLCFRHHISCFCYISPTKKWFQTQPQHCFASLGNLTVFRSWMNQPIKDLVQSQWLTYKQWPAATFNFTFKVSSYFKIISNISIQCLCVATLTHSLTHKLSHTHTHTHTHTWTLS